METSPGAGHQPRGKGKGWCGLSGRLVNDSENALAAGRILLKASFQ